MLVKRTGDAPAFAMMVWASVVAPWPVLAFSYAVDPQPSLIHAITHASWLSLAVAVYLGVPSTLLAYGLWSYLLQRYPAATVAPFSLLVPATGIISSALILGETFSPLRLAGMALILAGLAVGFAALNPSYALSPIFFSRGSTSSQKYGSSSA